VDVLRLAAGDAEEVHAGHQLRRLHGVVAAVLCNVSQHQLIRRALADAEAAPTLVQLLR